MTDRVVKIKLSYSENGDQIDRSQIPPIYYLRKRAVRSLMAKRSDVGSEVLYSQALVNDSFSGDSKTIISHFEGGISVTRSCVATWAHVCRWIGIEKPTRTKVSLSAR
jgi:hypothetical protein